MACGSKETGGVYLPAPRLRLAGRPRHPQQSPFYQLVERFFRQFEAVYEERYQQRYCFWRPIGSRL
jgi:hypothetical protein